MEQIFAFCYLKGTRGTLYIPICRRLRTVDNRLWQLIVNTFDNSGEVLIS